MLFGENRGRDKHRHLPSALHRLERRANRDFRLAISDVANEQTIHWTLAFEIFFYVRSRLALVGRVFKQERTFELTLPRTIEFMRRPRGDLAARVQLEQLLRHLENRHARFFALLLPAISAKFVETRCRCIVGNVGGAAIAFDLIDAIERHVQSIPALVLDYRGFNRAFANEDPFDAAIDADAVFKVHDIVAGLERTDGVERCAGRVLAGAAHAPITTENLVIGQNPNNVRDDEAATQHADRQRRGDGSIFNQQFFETLGLPSVVAQDDGVQAIALETTEDAQVAGDRFRCA